MIPLSAINQLAAAYRGAARQEAYLELAQEHFLDWMRAQHLFEDEAVVFKGRGVQGWHGHPQVRAG